MRWWRAGERPVISSRPWRSPRRWSKRAIPARRSSSSGRHAARTGRPSPGGASPRCSCRAADWCAAWLRSTWWPMLRGRRAARGCALRLPGGRPRPSTGGGVGGGVRERRAGAGRGGPRGAVGAGERRCGPRCGEPALRPRRACLRGGMGRHPASPCHPDGHPGTPGHRGCAPVAGGPQRGAEEARASRGPRDGRGGRRLARCPVGQRGGGGPGRPVEGPVRPDDLPRRRATGLGPVRSIAPGAGSRRAESVERALRPAGALRGPDGVRSTRPPTSRSAGPVR